MFSWGSVSPFVASSLCPISGVFFQTNISISDPAVQELLAASPLLHIRGKCLLEFLLEIYFLFNG